MEARRTFQGDVKGSRIGIVVAALLAAIALGLAGGYAAKGLTSVSAPAKVNKVNVVQPDAQDHSWMGPAPAPFTAPDAKDHSWMGPAAAPYAPSHLATRKHQTVF
jgi:hypothetical protein